MATFRGSLLGTTVRFLLLVALLGGPANAEGAGASGVFVDPAPAAADGFLRDSATAELGALFGRWSTEERRKLAGTYVAFDPSVTDVGARIGCDDDGDYVVVVTLALLRLATFIAKAEAMDETFGTHKLDEYSTFLAAAEPPGVRPLPPPVGFFDAPASRPAPIALASVRFREMVAAILAHELTYLVRGDLVCPNPTATHERGDDVWTQRENERSLAWALAWYTSTRVVAADGDATRLLLDRGLTEVGCLAWLRAVEGVEPPLWTYLRLHPDAPARAEAVRRAADDWRRAHAAPPRAAPHG